MEKKLWGGTLDRALTHAATRYDERLSRGKRYNPYALAQYFKRIDEVCEDVKRGADIRQALCVAFSGPLLAVMLKAAGEDKPSKDELSGFGKLTYQPISKE
jgi:hypothetical protein